MANLTCVCGRRLRVFDEDVGGQVKCPSCASLLTVPRPAAITPTPPDALPPDAATLSAPLPESRPRRGTLPLWPFLLGGGLALALLALAVVVLIVMRSHPSFPGLNSSKADIARTKAFKLEAAAQGYYLKNGQWPNQLSDLTQPDPLNNDPPWCKDDDLIDPWGQPYQMTIPGQHNNGDKPDIFTFHPDSGQEIGNWK
jgi:hypothetical protein